MSETCDVCEGSGDYPIYDRHGSVRMTIVCPECFGSGEAEDPQLLATDPSVPPASTAAGITSMEDLRAFVERHNSNHAKAAGIPVREG